MIMIQNIGKILGIVGMFLFVFFMGILFSEKISGNNYQPFIEELEYQYFLNEYTPLIIERCKGWEISYFNGSEYRVISFDTYDEIQRVCGFWEGPFQGDCVFYDEKNISLTVSVGCVNHQEIMESIRENKNEN